VASYIALGTSGMYSSLRIFNFSLLKKGTFEQVGSVCYIKNRTPLFTFFFWSTVKDLEPIICLSFSYFF
jgi:hypothetical protein